MTLPRFTTGAAGSLEWHHLNRVFDLVEGHRQNQNETHADVRRPSEAHPLIVATTGAVNVANNDHAWEEATFDYSSLSWQNLQNGRNSGSGAGTSMWKYPARTLDGSRMAVGSLVVLVPKRDKGGKLYYLIITTLPTGSFPFRIVSSTPMIPNRQWKYLVVEQRFNPPADGGNASFSDKSQAVLEMFNSVEFIADTTPPNPIYGVGMSAPTFSQLVRAPLRDNLVVMATRLENQGIVCCVPNGYRVTCGNP